MDADTNTYSTSKNINSSGIKDHSYDAIVIGSGITGGWAAKELCEKGMKTLLLERGRDVVHLKDYPTANKRIWELPRRGQISLDMMRKNPIASSCYAFDESTQHFFVKDDEHPYTQKKPFNWIRGYQVGGKSIMWGRWTQRWSDLDFEANLKDGLGIDWPIRYKDIAPWYSYVEKFVGISGNRDGIPHLPDGEFMKPMEMNCLEKHLKASIESNYQNRHLIISRTANLSEAMDGRGKCQYRDKCARGCPYGGYFSSNSATLPAAMRTGNLTLRPNSVVHSIIYDDKSKQATGVRVVDALDKSVSEYFAKVIFVNAGTINTTAILLNSVSERFPEGMGNDSGALGHYLMDHNYRASLGGQFTGLQNKYHFGNRPTGVYIPRFRNLGDDKQDKYVRGFAFAAGGSRRSGRFEDVPFGATLKAAASEASVWDLWMTGMGECLPYYENKISLSSIEKDSWDMPKIEIDCEYKDNEINMLEDILATGAEMLEKAGFSNVYASDSNKPPGLGIHEMGTARMGREPKTSVLNSNNQIWGVKNVFVTDGSCMTSSACQNPSLTYMALTARAVDFAVTELKKRNI
ncbi:MAG TPA: GMC family oxidoreductase [Anditalea sp.]|nr:GMC family oxidoreductase [Anditalea sp.]